ncbi:MAG TPA: TIGR00725 family protein [candidate division Zixibacteria bacterium]
MAPRPATIAVCGGGAADGDVCAQAEEVGRRLAEAGARVLTGGLGGVMEAASRGARKAGGVTIAIVPGVKTELANESVDIAIASGMAEGRNVMIIQTADGVIALPGQFGTLSEVAFALLYGKPVVSLGSWRPDPAVIAASDAETAVRLILSAVGRAGAAT